MPEDITFAVQNQRTLKRCAELGINPTDAIFALQQSHARQTLYAQSRWYRLKCWLGICPMSNDGLL